MRRSWFRHGSFRLALGLACLVAPAAASASTARPAPAPTGDIVELAGRYENGEGVERDYGRARSLYCRAADQGDPNAFLSLGWMYLNGRGVAIDDGIAVRWLRKAAERGIPQAVNLLQTMASIAPSKETGCAIEMTGRPAPPMPAPPREIGTIVGRAAREAGLNPDLVLAVIWVESQFNPRAVSVKNARGLMQLMPDTAARFHVENPFDPAQNIRGGTRYLRWLLDRFDGDLRLALGAYNAGEKAVEAFNGVPSFPETINYVANVIRLYGASLPSDAGRVIAGKTATLTSSAR